MSRSTRKAIYKDVGHRKREYWRVHRRINKQIVNHFFESAKEPSAHYWLTDFDKNYFEAIEKYENQGMSREEAYYEALYEHEYDFWWSRMVGNSCREWWEEPELKNSKELVNDYDYSDYSLDFEHGKSWNDSIKRKLNRK